MIMSYTLEFTETALADIEKHKKSADKAVLKKIEKLLTVPGHTSKTIERNTVCVFQHEKPETWNKN